MLALWLTKLGVPVRILDRTAEPSTTSRALAVHARTLELYEQLDLAEGVMKNGLAVRAINLWASSKHGGHGWISAMPVAADLSPATRFFQMFPQDELRKTP